MPINVKYSSKEKSEKFLDQLKITMEDPIALVPQCLHEGMLCPFVQYRKKIYSMVQANKLDRYAGSADQFLSGVSETYKVISSGSVPILGTIHTPFGNLEYSKRGNTDEVVLAGVQNSQNETFRMLAFSSLVKSRGVRIYSSKTRFLATCKDDAPDIDFFEEILNEHSIPCTKHDIIEIGNSESYMDLIFLSKVTIRIHDDYRQNIIPIISKHILVRNPELDFTISCNILSQISDEVPMEIRMQYLSGKADTRTIIDGTRTFRKKKALSMKYFIIGDSVYKTAEEFLMAVENVNYDPMKINGIIENLTEGLELETPSFRKLLEMLWKEHRDEIISIYYPESSPEERRKLSGDPLSQLNQLGSIKDEIEVDNSISVSAWSPDAEFLLELIKIHRKRGSDEASRYAERNLTNSIRKSIYIAYLSVTGDSKKRGWMFSPEQSELALRLAGPLKFIISGNAEQMKEGMEELKKYGV